MNEIIGCGIFLGTLERNKLKESKSVDDFFEKTSSKAFGIQKKNLNSSLNRKYWENMDPNFFVFYSTMYFNTSRTQIN